ncbi:MAG: NADPH-dependent assimilatory sulfite reductase hemoprotein subunit [Candidatus Velthaea sp.]
MSKLNVEQVKAESRGLRGSIPEELAAPQATFGEEAATLLKFHGIYQQDDRDARKSAREGGGKDYSFMIRTKNPGGFLPGPFYLAIDRLADEFGNGTIRVTTRGGLQLHGVRKANLQHVVAQINAHVGSTLGACGDINRNVMAPPVPFTSAPYAAAREAARRIADLLTPQATAYYEVWQDGEVVHSSEPKEEPIYGVAFLPRKFKIAVAVPGDNSVDLYTNDLGVVPLVDAHGKVLGYNLAVGGGLGMTHGKTATFPRLADEFAFVPAERLLEAVRAIVIVQRDNGDRTNRKHARLKYLIADRGLEWFQSAVEAEAGFTLERWRELPPWAAPQHLGWNETGDGTWFYGLSIANGRVRDERKAALREIVATFGIDLVATPDQDILLTGILANDRAAVDEILTRHGVAAPASLSAREKASMACPALPTCGLALAESERVLPAIIAALDALLARIGLADEPVAIRMTGCPNGCARPYMGEIGIVGVSADKYNLYLGGNPASTRLNRIFREGVRAAEIATVLTPLLTLWRAERNSGEAFGDFCVRTAWEKIAS